MRGEGPPRGGRLTRTARPVVLALAGEATGRLRAAWWAWRVLRGLRRSLPREGLRAAVPSPPRLPASAGRGLALGLRGASPTCLERSLVLQRWLAAHGERRDVVIGVQPGGARLGAHAWIDGSEPEAAAEYTELHRIPAP